VLLVKTEESKDETLIAGQLGSALSKIKNHVEYGESDWKEQREFRLIEIISECEVKEYFKFNHTYYRIEGQ